MHYQMPDRRLQEAATVFRTIGSPVTAPPVPLLYRNFAVDALPLGAAVEIEAIAANK